MENELNKNNNNKKIIIIIIIIIVVLIIGSLLCIKLLNKTNNNNNTNNTEQNNETPSKDEFSEEEIKKHEEDPDYYEKMKDYQTNEECVNKGNVCNIFDIGNGIELKVDVNDNETYSFHVIDNDENTLTLLSDDSIVSSSWRESEENFFGPDLLIKNVFEKTSSWTNVNYQDFEYVDYGYKNYKQNCYEGKGANELCNMLGEGIGYEKINISSTGASMKNSFGENISLSNKKVYARPATYEEISELFAYNNKITWLENKNAFWTMTSSMDERYVYSGAYLIKSSSETSTGITITPELITKNHDVPVVITIDKK